MEPLFIILFVVVIAVVAVVSVKNKQQAIEAWRRFGKEHQLRMLNAGAWSNPRLEGRFRDLNVTLQVEVHGSGKHRKTFTRAVARFPGPMPRGLNITSEGFTDRLAKLVGGQDIQIGYPELDRKLRIQGEDEAAVRILMKNWRARDAIAAFLTRDAKATVTQHQCSLLRSGFVRSPLELRGMLESVSRTVQEVGRGLLEDSSAPASPGSASPADAVSRPAPEPDPVSRFEWEGIPEPQRQALTDLLAEVVPDATVQTTSRETVEITTFTLEGGESSLESWSSDTATQSPSKDLPLPSADMAVITPVMFERPGEPQVEPPASAQGGDEVPLEELLALEDRATPGAVLRSRVAAMIGRPVRLELEVERVSLTMGVGVPAALEGGRTVIARPQGHSGPRLAVRFPEGADDALGALGYGDKLTLRGVFVSWDDFYRQIVVDVV